MQIYLGPTLKPHSCRFNDICFVDDHIGDGDNESWNWFQDMLASGDTPVILEYLACNLARVRCLPLQTFYTAWTLAQFVPERPWADKIGVFNFSVNKQIPNRLALIKYLDDVDIKTSHYSKSWHDQGQHPKKVWLYPGQKTHGDSILNGSLGNVAIFESCLRQHVYEPTVISLITEPVWDQPAAFISEKTVFALESGTIPIWCGGYGIPNAMADLGFDVFGDIVDHSYQFGEPDALGRVHRALELNQELLKSNSTIKLATDFKRRLEYNRRHLRSCNWFYHMAKSATRDMTVWHVHEIYRDLILQRNYELPSSCRVRELVPNSA